MRVALLFKGAGDLEGGGGAERFFTGLLRKYKGTSGTKHRLYLLTSRKNLTKLRALDPELPEDRLIFIPEFHNRFKNELEALFLLFKVLLHHIDLVQVPQYDRYYLPLIKALDRSGAFRPRLALNIIANRIPYYYHRPEEDEKGMYERFAPLFQNVRLDGVMAWNRNFEGFAKNDIRIEGDPYVKAIGTRYVDTERFNPSENKEKVVIFASRLDAQKRPFLFLEAVRRLKAVMDEDVLGEWNFKIYGRGNLEDKVQEFIQENGLGDLVEWTYHPRMEEVFPKTSCYVSTQMFDNFPSLAMAEAMACGNAVVAMNVGDTDRYVEDGRNGYLVEEGNGKDLADKLQRFIEDPCREKMMKESRQIMVEEHTPKRFFLELEAFWEKVAAH